MSFSTYLETHLLDQIWGNATALNPATLYVALSTGVYTAAVVEPSGNGYARATATNNATNFPASTGGGPATKSNGVAIAFPAATGSWGTIQSVAIYDAVTAGNLLYQGAISPTQAVNTGMTPAFAIGGLVITLN